MKNKIILSLALLCLAVYAFAGSNPDSSKEELYHTDRVVTDANLGSGGSANYTGTYVYALARADAWAIPGLTAFYPLSGSEADQSDRPVKRSLPASAQFSRSMMWTNDNDRNKLLETGDAVVTCGVINAADPVVALFEVRTPVTTAGSYDLVGGNYPIWNRPEELHPASWSFTNLGNVFGLAIDRERNIYATASSSYSPQLNLLSQANGTPGDVNFQSGTGAIGRAAAGPNATAELNAAGTIYKLDAATGNPTVFAVLPQQSTTAAYTAFIRSGVTNFNLSTGNRANTGPGLGNIAYDKDNDQFFVSNFEDGKIYRVSSTGTVQPVAYDFGTPDNGAAGMPALQDRVWGLGIFEGRLYYSIWTDRACQNDGNCGNNAAEYYDNGPNPTIKPFIRSLAIDPLTGEFLTATDQLEYDGSDLEHTAPISDIAFDADGNMLIAQKSMLTDYAGYNHRSQVAYLTGGNGTWIADPFLTAPRENPTNANRYGTEAYGGVDFGYDGAADDATIWYSSADMVRDANIANGSQGPHGFAGFRVSDLMMANDLPDPRAIIPYDGGVTSPNSVDLKGSGGDIEIVGDYVSLGNLVWEDTNDNGLLDGAEAGIPNVTVNLLNVAGTVVLETTTTNAAGQYLFTDLLPGDYIVEILPPAGYGTSTGSMLLLSTGPYEPAPDPDMLVAIDSDDNGSAVGTSIRSAVVTLEETGEPVGEAGLTGLTDFVADNSANYTVDFGLIPPCDITLDAFTVQCTNGTDFTVSFNVNYSTVAAPASASVDVSVAGAAQASFTPAGPSGTMAFGPIPVAGPAYGLLVEAMIDGDQSCSATALFDLIACTPDCVDGAGTLGGNVFNDFNNDGADAGAEEVGQANVLVLIYECDNPIPVDTAYTNAVGDWSVDAAGITFPVRVEFSTPLQDYLESSAAGMNNGTNTQFIEVANCNVDYGVIVTNEYCQDNPLVIVPCYFSGPQDNNRPALVGVYYNNPDSDSPTEVGLVNDTEIGTTYGVAYQSDEEVIYASAMVRHFFDYGPGGFDAIYAIDFTDVNGSAAPAPAASLMQTIDLSALGVNMGIDPRTSTLTGNAPYNDGNVYQSVGKAGIGDIDISADNDTLFVVNLNTSAPSLVMLDVSDPVNVTLIAEVLIPDPGCVGGAFAPWGAKYYNGKLYVGGVCTAENSQSAEDMVAYVYRYDGASSFTEVISTPLDYDRSAATYRSDNTFSNADWQPWTNTWNPDQLPLGGGDLVSQPMPILQDIEFTDSGDMILGFGDRFTYQTAFGNRQPGLTSGPVYTPVGAGDVIQVCYEDGVFSVEGSGGCPQLVTDLGSTNVPSIPAIVEYYDDNYINEFSTQAGHAETALGGITRVSGKGEILVVSYDARKNQGPVNTSGIRFINDDGSYDKGWTIVAQNDPAANRKGGSLGDAEALCAPLPIQIGNYVWIDADEDGVQDACEEPVTGLPVTLYTQDDVGTLTQVGMTTTDPVTGEYYFNDVIPDTSYLIVFGDMPESDTSFVYNNTVYGITQDSTGEGSNPGLNDSDGTFTDVNGINLPAISYNTADTTDHTLDLGLIPLAVFDLALIKTVNTVATPGPFSPDSTVTFSITVYNQGDTDATDIEVKDYVPAGLSLAPASAPDWTISADTAILTTPFSLVAGADSILSISFVIDTDFMGDTLVNRAEISAFDDDNDPLTDPPVDEDSTPNDNGMDDPEADTPDELDDDGNGTPGTEDDPNDEDDYDFEGIPVLQSFDLALIKRIDLGATPGPFTYGSTVTFSIDVTNQGSLDATDVEVADYIPDGLTLVPSAIWTMDVDTARLALPFNLAAGATENLSISFTIDLDFAGDMIDNVAEISAAENALNLPDEDSTPGDNGNDDPEVDTDDEGNDDGPNGNGTADNPADADDFDFARVSIETLSLGSTVFLDNNNDGLQNTIDTGIANVEVQLFDAVTMMQILTDANGARVLDAADAATVTTNANGDYHFTNLLPGDYYVVIPTAPATAPLSSNNTGIAFTETDPDDDTDNDDEGIQAGGSGTSVSSDTITLSLGGEPVNGTTAGTESSQGNMQDDAFDDNGNMTLDFGFFAPVSVGDTAFVDLDGNGLQTMGEPGIGGVTVILIGTDGDTVMVDAEGNAITGITMTAPDGSYLFPDLPPGSYSVIFNISTADNAEFYDFTTANAGIDTDDSDNSIVLTDSTAQSDFVPFLNSGEQDLSLDVGVICAIEVIVADPFTICSTQPIVLNDGASITPASLGGSWSTPDGTGEFTTGMDFATATTYTPSKADAQRGSVTLILTTDEPDGPCEAVSNQVTIQILNVDCGDFFWGGQ